MVRKLSYLLLAGAAAVSFSAIAADNQSKQSQGQSDQTQAQSSQYSQSSQSPDTVKQAQEKLSAAGMDTGPTDGKLGPKTEAAVKEFQQSKGIKESGKLDQQTLAALGVNESSGSASSGSTGSASSPSSSSGASSPSSSDTSSGSTGSSGKSSKY
jgi:peptidoglycan hydrolase-like protein with peptidoglycan-binding domain